MPFSVLIIEKHPVIRIGLEQLFREQFGKDDDLVVAVDEAAQTDETELKRTLDQEHPDLIVYRLPFFPQDDVLDALIERSLFRAVFFKRTGNPLEDHMLSCHSGDVAVAIDEPNWGQQLAKKAKKLLCSQLVNGGLDALFGERDYRRPASPYEGRFDGPGLTHRLAELIRIIEKCWYSLDERTRTRVEKQFHVGFDKEIDGQRIPVLITLRRRVPPQGRVPY
jgi:hypothetical protein